MFYVILPLILVAALILALSFVLEQAKPVS
jgi:hypothetical protein